jgi:hypothetical protein
MPTFPLPPRRHRPRCPTVFDLSSPPPRRSRPTATAGCTGSSTTATGSPRSSLTLLGPNIRDRTQLFRAPFQPLLAAGLPALVLDGEIAVPDAHGVTHIDQLSAEIAERRLERFAYFAFDLLDLDGHDLSSAEERLNVVIDIGPIRSTLQREEPAQ